MSDFENKSKMNTSCNYMKEEKLLGRNIINVKCIEMSSHLKNTQVHTHMHTYVHKHTLLAKILLEIFKY